MTTQTETIQKSFQECATIKNLVFKFKIPYYYVDVSNKLKEKNWLTGQLPYQWQKLNWEEAKTKRHKDKNQIKNNLNKKNKNIKWFLNLNMCETKFIVADCDSGDHLIPFYNYYGKNNRTKSTGKQLPHTWFIKNDKDNKTTRRPNKKNEFINDEGKSIVDILREGIIEDKDSPIISKDTIGVWKEEWLKDEDEKEKKDNKTIIKKKKKKKEGTDTTVECTNHNNKRTEIDFDKYIDLIGEENFKIIKNIDNSYLINYDSWLKIIWAIKQTYIKVNKELTINFIWDLSRSVEQYKNISKNDIISYLNDDKQNIITFGTICYYSKLSNKEQYKYIRAYHTSFIGGSDTALAKRFLELQDEVIYHEQNFYIYMEPYWRLDNTKNVYLKTLICNTLSYIINYTKNMLRKKIDKLDPDDPLLVSYEKQIENLENIIKKVLNETPLNSICSSVKRIIESKKDKINYPMDTEYFNIICFNNIAFDLCYINKKGKYELKEVKIEKNHFISSYIEYDYRKASEDEYNEVEERINEIMPDLSKKKNKEGKHFNWGGFEREGGVEGEKDEYGNYLNKNNYHHTLINILFNCLIGTLSNRFIIFIGNGGNGKGWIMSFLNALLGNLFYSANSTFLTQPFKSGSNPEIMCMRNKRAIGYEEPPEDKDGKSSIDPNVIKTLTNSKKHLEARTHHKEMEKVGLQATQIAEVNPGVTLFPNVDPAIVRRILYIFFPSYIMDMIFQKRKWEKIENQCSKNNNYNFLLNADDSKIQTSYYEQHKYALFEYIVKTYHLYLNNAPEHIFKNPRNIHPEKHVLKTTEQFLKPDSELNYWIQDNLEEDLDSFIELDYFRLKLTKKTITDEYGQVKTVDNDLYKNMSQTHKKAISTTLGLKKLLQKTILKEDIRTDNIPKKGTKRLAIWGWRFKVNLD